jgi:oxalate decarboxylase/phosphoglucose isomerase-like protein (cupin superfamily)
MGALLWEEVVEAGLGELVFTPRNQWHMFWNAGDEPCRTLEIISPAGFEQYFRELSAMGRPSESLHCRKLTAICVPRAGQRSGWSWPRGSADH